MNQLINVSLIFLNYYKYYRFNQDFVESSLLITESIEQCKNECQKDFDCPYFAYFTATDEITNINANS